MQICAPSYFFREITAVFLQEDLWFILWAIRGKIAEWSLMDNIHTVSRDNDSNLTRKKKQKKLGYMMLQMYTQRD